MMKLFEIDERGIVTQMSRLSCGTPPCGGEVVYARNKTEAQNLYFRYKDGERSLKGEVFAEGQEYPYKNVIREIE